MLPKLCFFDDDDPDDEQIFSFIRGYTLFFVTQPAYLALLTDWVFLWKKRSRDFLQGISKLDNLLKVSIIQNYKCIRKEDGKL